MSETSIQNRVPSTVKEKGQYLIAFGVVASMLVVANMPFFVVIFFGVFAFFLYKMFSAGPRSEVREVFEFYLSANEILRDDDRKWYGFELREAIERGEGLIQRMPAAPPLVHFATGALYNKVGDHKSALKYLGFVVENASSDEKAYVYPTPELRNYVKILRKIEREPAEAPLTSAAIRSLERARRLRGATLLEESRKAFSSEIPIPEQLAESQMLSETDIHSSSTAPMTAKFDDHSSEHGSVIDQNANGGEQYANRKPITEVLHDIYDTTRS